MRRGFMLLWFGHELPYPRFHFVAYRAEHSEFLLMCALRFRGIGQTPMQSNRRPRKDRAMFLGVVAHRDDVGEMPAEVFSRVLRPVLRDVDTLLRHHFDRHGVYS